MRLNIDNIVSNYSAQSKKTSFFKKLDSKVKFWLIYLLEVNCFS